MWTSNGGTWLNSQRLTFWTILFPLPTALVDQAKLKILFCDLLQSHLFPTVRELARKWRWGAGGRTHAERKM